MKLTKKQSILKKYVDLAFKLGKLPSIRESERFGITKGTVDYNYRKHSHLVKAALEKHPELKKLVITPKLATTDVETYRLGLEAKKNKKSNGTLTSDLSTLDYIAQFSDQVFSGRVKPSKFKKKAVPTTRTLNLVLSDLHIGGDLKGDETGDSDYGVNEEARRLASIIKEAATYKSQYRDVTHLELSLLGDIIENQLHDPRTGATIAEQCARAIHLLIQAVGYLALKFPTINVRCATGNHGRNTQRHAQRAVHQKFDSLETIIYYAVKMGCSELKNVTFFIPKTPIASYEVYGKKIGYTHGDSVISPGNPGSAINVRGLETQVNKLNAGLSDKEEYSVIIYGHTHTGHIVYLSNGAVLIGNGSLPPADHFAVSIGITESRNNGQMIFESVPGYPVGDLRYLKVEKSYDSDESLDSIIFPWKAF